MEKKSTKEITSNKQTKTLTLNKLHTELHTANGALKKYTDEKIENKGSELTARIDTESARICKLENDMVLAEKNLSEKLDKVVLALKILGGLDFMVLAYLVYLLV